MQDDGTSQNQVVGCYIGTDKAGAKAVANQIGVKLLSNNNTIGGAGAVNVISGNGGGMEISGSSGNLLVNNYIGTDPTGSVAVANTGYGVELDNGATKNTIGGTQTSLRNVISGNGTLGTGNSGYGIWLARGVTGNVVLGDYIGTDATGMNPLGNQNDGIYLELGADNNTIGGAAVGARNIISANGQRRNPTTQFGDEVDVASTGNLVQNNIIGFDATGATATTSLSLPSWCDDWVPLGGAGIG
jgi:titin